MVLQSQIRRPFRYSLPFALFNSLLQLTESERARLVARLQADSDAANREKFEWFFVRQALTDHLVWAYALLFHGFAFVLYSLSLFLVRACRMDEITAISTVSVFF